MYSLGLIIAAGGTSKRFGQGDKLQILYKGLPLLCHCLKHLSRPGIPTVVVCHPEHLPIYRGLVERHLPEAATAIHFTGGGGSRTESVYNGFRVLMALPTPPEYIAIHDAARPEATYELLERCAEAARGYGASVAAHRVTDTIHVADSQGIIASTPPRETLWGAETPQIFSAGLLQKAYDTLDWREHPATDEAGLVARLAGTRIQLVENTLHNPKITYAYDV